MTDAEALRELLATARDFGRRLDEHRREIVTRFADELRAHEERELAAIADVRDRLDQLDGRVQRVEARSEARTLRRRIATAAAIVGAIAAPIVDALRR